MYVIIYMFIKNIVGMGILYLNYEWDYIWNYV